MFKVSQDYMRFFFFLRKQNKKHEQLVASIVNYPEFWAAITGPNESLGKTFGSCYCSLDIFACLFNVLETWDWEFSIAQLPKVCQFLISIIMRMSDGWAAPQPPVTHRQHVSAVIRKLTANKFQQSIFLSPTPSLWGAWRSHNTWQSLSQRSLTLASIPNHY